MSSPSSRFGDSTMWKGPSTVDSVEVPPVRWLIVSTSIKIPRTSESRMNSCRTSLLICPGAGEEVDRDPPLLLGQLHVLDEGVQVVDQRGHHLLQPRARSVLEAGGDDLGRPLLAEQLPVGHDDTSSERWRTVQLAPRLATQPP